jgi:histidinol-phosphate aminotransferase
MDVPPDLAALRHHGDADTAPDLVDFATNVAGQRPPDWLRERLTRALDHLGHYPSTTQDLAARQALARRHGRDPDEVLILAGAAEGFAALPRLRPRLAAVVHPSFTEPEVVLRASGVPVVRVVLDGEFTLDPELVPEPADLVVLGNPTNPTSVLHPADTVARLARPGRTLVVDEAFMDAVPGEPESMAGRRLPGLVVLRSLTKTFSLAGLRVGYALAAPSVLATLVTGRPHWPVGTLALEAVTACCEPEAIAWTHRRACEIVEHRAWMLHRLPVPAVAPAHAPFLLLRTEDGPGTLSGLRARKIAARRNTFPGLTGDDVRVAVRAPGVAALLVTALDELDVTRRRKEDLG